MDEKKVREAIECLKHVVSVGNLMGIGVVM